MEDKNGIIRIRGARTHNLKGIDVDIKRNALTVITGLSGSGKSSLAFDTLYAEGQRRYVQSLSAYTRQFLDLMLKPDVESIEGLSPAIAIDQTRHAANVRSTVATATEIADFLRVLFARAGIPYCPEHHEKMLAQTVTEMVDAILARPAGERICIAAPVLVRKRVDFAKFFDDMQTRGYIRFRVDGKIYEAPDLPDLSHTERHDIDVIVDRLRVKPEAKQRVTESVEVALGLSDGRVFVFGLDTPDKIDVFSNRYACPVCGKSIGQMQPSLFSFNHPTGACEKCGGTGEEAAFTAESVVISDELSLADGAVYGFDKRSAKPYSVIRAFAEHFGFDEKTPWKDLPESVKDGILFGVSGGNLQNETSLLREGLIALLEKRFTFSSSAAITAEMNRYRIVRPCEACGGSRLNAVASHVVLQTATQDITFPEIMAMDIGQASAFFANLKVTYGPQAVVARLREEIARRLRFLDEVGLAYLRLDRRTDTLSGGEAQRVRLACQIGSGLSGVMYVLDEPSVGLHPRDTAKLLDTLRALRDDGNTVIVVEHDEAVIRAADAVIDMGPGAGFQGGSVVAVGSPEEIMASKASLTGRYLSGELTVGDHSRRGTDTKKRLILKGACGHNLKNVTASFPIGALTVVTGVSGSGKSSLVTDTLYAAASRFFYRSLEAPQPYESIEGFEYFDKVVNVDQSPIGRSPRSNPATYTGLFTGIREIFAETPTAKERGYDSGRFSFNVAGGRCEACQGEGYVKVQMHFLPDMYVPCQVCNATRYKRETLDVLYRGKTIADVLDLTVSEASELFAAHPALRRRLATLSEVGLGYIKLGQSALTLSGGEAQRMKLALELSKPSDGRTLYILDEPTTGLHFEDVKMLLTVLRR
ncbi:MAG TPA: excinuclease ABC subunit UvrA, partial [Sutterella sp.]|nr:excinuclease ABC subunit UvrA [Sutterella sp.]